MKRKARTSPDGCQGLGETFSPLTAAQRLSPTGPGGRRGMAETEPRRSHARRKTQAGAAAEPDGGLGQADLGVFRRGRGARGVPAPAIVEKETEGRSGLTRSVRRTP